MLDQTKRPDRNGYTMDQRAGTAVQVFEPGQGSGLTGQDCCAGLSRSRKGIVSVVVGVDVNQIVSAHLHSLSGCVLDRRFAGRFSCSESTAGMVLMDHDRFSTQLVPESAGTTVGG
jgi:hypothetical protein